MEVDNSSLWTAIQPKVQQRRPLIAHWVQVGTQLAFSPTGVLRIGFPPSEVHSRDSLMREATKRFLEELLAEVAGRPVKLEFAIDASLAAPAVVEYFLGIGEAPAAEAPPAAATVAPPAASGPAESKGEPGGPTDEGFYNDDLIKSALEIFKARVIK